MSRRRLICILPLAFAVACTSAAPAAPRSRNRTVPSTDMSQPVGRGAYCDYMNPPPSVRSIVGDVGKGPGFARGAALVRVRAVGPARWNTPDGRRPTQAQADAMPVQVSIVRPVTFEVERVYAGSMRPGTVVAFAESGTIGANRISSCAFGSPKRLLIREGPAVVSVGGSYVAFFASEMLTGRLDGPVHDALIDNLFEVHGGAVVGLAHDPEPLP